MTLSTEHLAALHSYKAQHGRSWKRALELDWYNARLGSCPAMPERGSLLHELRNSPQFGPTGLASFRFPHA